MARYIDAEKLCERLTELARYQDPHKQSTILGVVDTIELTPTADVVEVKHGYWKTQNCRLGDIALKCSNCNRWFGVMNANYCPNCGAKMDG